MIKNVKTKLITSFIMLLILMTTFVSYKAYALTETYSENGDLVISDSETKVITYNQYKSSWYVLCFQKGTTLKGIGGTYKKDGEYIATPLQAYILNNSKEEFDNALDYNTDYSVTQNAWWATSANIGNKVAENQLYATAKEYQNFISSIAKNKADIENTSTYKTMTHTFEDGKEVSIKFPEIDISKIDSTFGLNSSKIDVNFDKVLQQYVIGPFSLSYQQSSSNNVDFGSINGFDIYTDASSEALDRSQWGFVFSEYDATNGSKYPSANQTFYIRMNYIEGATKITGIDIDYRYLIAGGQYERVSGSYYAGLNGDFSATYNALYKAHNSQALGIIQSAARWYETTKIHINTNQAKLVVQKKALDENGNELTSEQVKELFGEDQYFDFTVKVTHSDGTVENSVVTVKAGSQAIVGTYVWKDGEEAPNYEVQEVLPSADSNWKQLEIINSKGKLVKDEVVTVMGVNKAKKDKSGTIELTKTISGEADADELFRFQIIVTMPNGEKVEDIAEITVPKGKTTGKTWSKEYKWYGDGEATYEIIELETEASKKYQPTINPSKGYLDGTGAKVQVNAYNNEIVKDYSNEIVITKSISEPAETDEVFEFEVTVTEENGTEHIEHAEITVPKGQTTGAPWKSETYTWKEGEKSPTYKIKEIENEFSKKYTPTITPSEGSLDGSKAEISVVAYNRTNINRNVIEITKTTSNETKQDEIFEFEVIVTEENGTEHVEHAEITVPKGAKVGNTWTSKEYKWTDDEKAPTYKIREIENEFSKKYTPIITPSEGSLDGSKAKIQVDAENKIAEHHGYLTVEKDLADGQVTDELFTFDVKVDGAENANSFSIKLKAGEKAGPFEYIWYGDEAPTFTVTESSNSSVKSTNIEVSGGENVKKANSSVTGNLVDGDIANVNVKFVNNMGEHSGKIKVVKNFFSEEKMTSEELKQEVEKLNVSFKAEIVIEGTFVYGNEKIQNSSKVITGTLSKDNNWTFTTDQIKWYGSSVPTYTVKEIELPSGWKCRSMNYSNLENESTNTEGHKLVDGNVVEVTIVNEIPSEIIIDLTFSMSGIVWVDDTLDEKNDVNGDGYYKAPNGVYDQGETLKENTEVTVYKVIYNADGNIVSREVAKAYKDAENNELTFPIITKSDGKWSVPRMPVAAVSQEQKIHGYTADYDVEFVYDGQTYEPTEFLSYKVATAEKDGYNKEYEGYYAQKINGSTFDRANEYKNTSPANQKEFFKDSMAIETTNNSKNIVEVVGKSEIDANGNTTGLVKLSDGSAKEVTYTSDNAGIGYPTQSKLVTTDKNGRVLDVFKASATTSVGYLTYPFNPDNYDGSSLTNVNKTFNDTGFETTYKFYAVYNHCLNINLGLKTRKTVDVALSKKLDNAKVIVKEKLYQYNYSGFYDLTEEKTNSLDKNIYVENGTEPVEYTLGLYKSDYYYRAAIYNASEDKSVYDALTNFYKTFSKSLNDTELDVYLTYKIKLENSSSAYDVKVNSIDDYYDNSFTLVTADETKYLKTQTIGGKETEINNVTTIANTSDYANNWVVTKTGIVGSDKNANGENIVYNKMTANNLGITLAPGESKEIITTFKVNKKYGEGIADCIELGQKCNVAEIASYTTYDTGTNNIAGKIDRDSAPSNINISAYNTKAWYEDDTFAAPILKINLVDDNKDRNITGTVWEDNSNNKNTENAGYNLEVGNGIKDSGEDVIRDLDTELVEKIMVQNTDGTYTQYDFTWPSDKKLDALGGRSLEELTGLDTTITTNSNGEYAFKNVAAGDYAVKFTYGNKAIESANYSNAKYYNGQDYKSSAFKGAYIGSSNLNAGSYLDVDNTNSSNEHKNVAIDNEIRRLQVVANSREITYANNAVMAEYQDGLFNDYWMFAETPKLDMNIELSSYGSNNYDYTVANVDFGLEERPSTVLTLDKQIEEIILTTSDGNTIMDAKYNIDYTVNDDGSIKANVTLDESNSYGTDNLQSLNRDQATNQGFRYINVDSSILEGTTITAKYRFTALNTGEVDRTGKLVSYDLDINEACRELSNKMTTFRKSGNSLVNNTEFGEYVGSIYYFGANGSQNDNIVTTTVRQIIDYIDNDVTFSGMLNATANTSWSNVSIDDLKTMIKDSIFTELEDGTITVLDDKGVKYETENRNNIILSVDNNDANSSINNAKFIVELVPANAVKNGYTTNDYKASMNLTTTRYVGADSDDLQIDNIAEIIKYNNTVGRRDELIIVGNQNPAEALDTKVSITSSETLSDTMVYERDTSATEVITLAPPTGAELSMWKLQFIAAITGGLIILAGGVILIKKKVLK